MFKKKPIEEWYFKTSCLRLITMMMTVIIISGCSSPEKSGKTNPAKAAADVSATSEEPPVQSLKQTFAGMGAEETVEYINRLTESPFSVKTEDGALWLVASNGNGANLVITVLIHQKFTDSGKEYHKYYFTLKNAPNPEQMAPFMIMTEEMNHGEMIHALQRLQELARE